jgi:copper chaperone
MIELHVEKMTCGGCASRVTRAVLAVDDAARVNVNLKSKTVQVESDLDSDTVASAITQAGYPAHATAWGQAGFTKQQGS